MEAESSPEDVFLGFVTEHCRDDLITVLQEPDFDRHYGIPVSLCHLAAHDHGAAEVFLASPRPLLPLLDAALVSAQRLLLQGAPSEDAQTYMSVKENVHARLQGLSMFLDIGLRLISPGIDDIAAIHIHRLITVRGTVVRTGAVKLLQSRRLYECGRCRHRFVVEVDLEADATVQLPSSCPSSREKQCPGTSFRHCEDVALYTNFQEITLQERDQVLNSGSTTRSLIVFLQDDLAESCLVGDAVEITGLVIRQFGPMYPGMRCHVGLALHATSVIKAPNARHRIDQSPETVSLFQQYWDHHFHVPFLARDAIVKGMCPQLCGLYTVKLASLLMLIGGISKTMSDANLGDGTTTVSLQGTTGGGARGEIHFLLIGDPGTGKSQFQRYISQLAPRSVVASGNASSAAGLTAAAVKDGAQWCLEAGALVLADGGVCCIDEFDAVREADRASLHEAMEQQTVSIAKAGLVTTLHTRASVFGTCNPKGHKRYNVRRPLAEQLNIGGPLLSRFDIVLLLLDDINPKWDESIAEHILNVHRCQRKESEYEASGRASVSSRLESSQASRKQSPMPRCDHAAALKILPQEGTGLEINTEEINLQIKSVREDRLFESIETLRQYIAWVKTFHPVMSPQAEQILVNYYQLRRKSSSRQASRTTIRLLESLVRLAQAHARLMARRRVETSDAVVTVALVDASVVDGEAVLDLPSGVGLSGPGNTFWDSPDQAYRALEAAVIAAVSEGFGVHPLLPANEMELLDWKRDDA